MAEVGHYCSVNAEDQTDIFTEFLFFALESVEVIK